MKSWVREFALGLLLATAIPSAPVLAAQSAEQLLLDKANYWRLKDRPDLAAEALKKLLSINPNQAEALYQFGIIQVQQNKIEDAKSYLARLQKVAPSSPRIADLENAIRAGQVSPNELNEARRLAQTGQFTQATEKYQQTFKGPPPTTFGVEYYMTLAGTPNGIEEARRGLERLVQNSPNDSKAKLALAQVLTFQANTRAQGVRMLAQLSDDPVVGQQAVEAWKRAVMWLGWQPQDRQFYAQYLAKFPNDAEVRQHMAEMQRTGGAGRAGGGPGPSAVGYADLNRGNLGAAERQFEAELRRRPGDPDALAGLGLVRLRQQHFGEARNLLGRAMQASPGRRGQWAAAYDSATFWSGIQSAKAARDAGNYQQARSILSGLVNRSRSDNWNAELLLGDVETRLGNYPVAEQAYRSVLAVRPDDPDANLGLYGVLTAEGKTAEAAQLQARLATLDPRRIAGLNRTRAELLRNEGKALESRGDAAAAQAKYQEAIAVDPNDAWARLDLARLLARFGNLPQAYAVVDPAASAGTAESLEAAAIFYSEQNRPREAVALLARIPPGSRNTTAASLYDRLLVTAEIDRAKQLARSGNRLAARNVLVALNSRPPASADKTRLIADALTDIGDVQEALILARPNPATAGRDPRGSVEYAALLTRAGRDAEATAYLAQAESTGRFGPDERTRLERTKIQIAATRADQLRTRGDIAGAYDQISALLAAYPNDPNLLLAAGRIYAAAGQNSTAMRFIDAAFREAPTDLGIIRGAVGGAIVAGDLDRARAYLAAGMQAHPNHPRLYYMEAEIARASGDNGRAMYDLQVARALDSQQSFSFQPGAPPAGTAVMPGSPGMLPPNPFRRSDAGDLPALPFRLIGATPAVAATAAPEPLPPPPGPLAETAISADSDDLVIPPRANERPPRPKSPGGTGVAGTAPPDANDYRLAALPPFSESGSAPGTFDPASPTAFPPATPPQLSQLTPLSPPPIAGYSAQGYSSQGGYVQPAAPNVAPMSAAGPTIGPAYPTASYAPAPIAIPAGQGYPAASYVQSPAAGIAPLPPPPLPGYRAPSFGQPAPIPQDSLELDIERSMAAIAAESAPMIQGGLSFRGRSGENGLSRLNEIGAPIEGTFSPFYTGTARLQAIPTFLDAGRPETTALLRFGHEALIALNPGATFANAVPVGSQTAGGVSLNAGYAYQMFAGEIGTTPLGFPVENLVGRIALMWPGPATLTTALPTIPLAPTTVPNPLQVKVEGVRQPVTDSVLSFAGTRDPVANRIWGGVIKTGGDALVSYDDGDVGVYGGGGIASIDGRSVASNSEVEGIVGAYVRPYRSGLNAFKIGLNLSYMGYDKNLRFFTFGQGGYFSPQTYLNFSVPLEYSGRTGRWTYLAGGSLGVQTFNERSSPVFPTEPGNQNALRAAFGNLAFYPSRNVTGLSFGARGQVEYQLDNGFTIGGLASVDNAQNYTEGIAKVYLRKSFGATLPTALTMPNALPGSL